MLPFLQTHMGPVKQSLPIAQGTVAMPLTLPNLPPHDRGQCGALTLAPQPWVRPAEQAFPNQAHSVFSIFYIFIVLRFHFTGF